MLGDLARPTGPARRPRRPRSATGTRPRCRDGASIRVVAAARRAPGCRSPRARRRPRRRAAASRPCSGSPRRSADPGSKVLQAVHDRRRRCATAAEMSTTSTTGASISRATCAVEANPSPPIGRRTGPSPPRRRRRPPVGARAAPCSSSGTSWSSPTQVRVQVAARVGRWPARGSRGRCSPGRSCSRPTSSPSARSAAISPVATVVLPCPEAGAAITTRGSVRHQRASPFDAPLTLLAGVHRVLDLGHLGDQSAISISLGSARRPVIITCCCPGRLGQRRHHVVDVDPAPVDRVGELVQHVQPVGLARPAGA